MKKQLLSVIIILFSFTSFSQTEFETPNIEATYVGGIAEQMKYFTEKVSEKIDYKVGGARVYVEFILSESGEVLEAKVIRGYDQKLDEIALNAVKNMPKWNPAKNKNGKTIKSKLVLPIVFE